MGNPVADDNQGEAPADRMKRLEAILGRFEITIAEANDLVALEDYEIVCILDDSGSMQLPAQEAGARTLGQQAESRWDELKTTASLLVEIGNCFDSSGLDLFFLNRPPLKGVKSQTDPALVAAFSRDPSGSTPLTETLQVVAKEVQGERPVLLFICTDGEPNGGVKRFVGELERLVKKQSTTTRFKVQIMACTGDEDAIGWLAVVDEKFTEVDVVDDYYSEKKEVLAAKKTSTFTRGDWLIKALLGPISQKFDGWDEKSKNTASGAQKSSACTLL